LLLAELVGPGGVVIGLDHDEGAVTHARERALAAGAANLTFLHSDFSDYVSDTPLDAIVGRFVLMYQPDPIAALAKITKQLRPAGVVAFIEPWFQVPGGPDSTMKTVIACIVETLRRSGAHVDLGPRLHRVFAGAGLPVPNMRFETLLDAHEDSPLYDYVANTMASLLPKAIEYGVSGAADLDVTSIAARLRAEMKAVGYAMMSSPAVCGWC
jgi:trans-aconitate methyltransferase